MNSTSLWKLEQNCSEAEVVHVAAELAKKIRSGERILLEGQMGAGKSTFTRYLLTELKVEQPPEGSPTFAIAHEYQSSQGEVIHIDFYRIKSEMEIDEAGIPSYYWERNAIVVSEWLSSWPEFEAQVLQSGTCWRVNIDYIEDQPFLRKIKIELLDHANNKNK